MNTRLLVVGSSPTCLRLLFIIYNIVVGFIIKYGIKTEILDVDNAKDFISKLLKERYDNGYTAKWINPDCGLQTTKWGSVFHSIFFVLINCSTYKKVEIELVNSPYSLPLIVTPIYNKLKK